MSAFLDHLAGRAQGVPSASAARPSLPSRFAGPQAWGGQAPDSLETPALPTAAPVEAQSQTVQRIAPQVREAISPAPLSAPAKPAEAASAAPLPHAAIEIVAPVASAVTPRTDRSGEERGERPSAAEVSMRAAATPMQFAPQPTTPPAVPTAAAPTNATPARAPSAPLSEAAVAGRTKAAEPQPPVIHLTIDRIDVRVPAPAKPATPERRPRAQPAVSLTDYLAAKTRGTGA